MPDTAAMVAAADRFLRAWTVATQGNPLPLTDPAVIEVHEAAQELISATETTNVRAAYHVLDELVLSSSWSSRRHLLPWT
jgi:hypothetical protein